MPMTPRLPGTARALIAGIGLLLGAGLALAQAVPPPGVEAARPPTERTLQPVDRSQTRERVPVSRDCRKESADIRAQYRIQADSLRKQYAGRLEATEGAERAALLKERDGKLATLGRDGDVAVKRFSDKCHEDNAALLHSPVSPADLR